MSTLKIQDKYNEFKVWVIRKTKNEYTWNQEINGELFYPKFTGVSKGHIESVLGIQL